MNSVNVIFTFAEIVFLDWALLSSDLQFIYLDPVLNYHLGEQAELLVGKSLLSFVHPDEQASAKRDLGSVLDSKTLHGSVTRCVSAFIIVFTSHSTTPLSFNPSAFAIPGYLLFGDSSVIRVRVLTGLTLTKCRSTETTSLSILS